MSTPEIKSAADEYYRALIEGAAEEAHADALAVLGDDLEREGFGDFAAVFWEISHHHRAQMAKHRASADWINSDPEG